MAAFRFEHLPDKQRDSARWTCALLGAIAREEVRGRLRPRLTEPELATWRRFKGRLTSADLVDLLFEDAAVLHRFPFSGKDLNPTFAPAHLPEDDVSKWIQAAVSDRELAAPSTYVEEQARLLQLSSRMARSDLHVVKPHQKVLELPGTGGQLAHHLVNTQRDLTLQDNFTVACGTWQELALAGIIALDLGAPHSDFVTRVEPAELKAADHPLRQRSFDFVIGVHPDKGGVFRVEDQLAIWFPAAKVLLI